MAKGHFSSFLTKKLANLYSSWIKFLLGGKLAKIQFFFPVNFLTISQGTKRELICVHVIFLQILVFHSLRENLPVGLYFVA